MLHVHSLRIGGMLLRWNLGADIEELKWCGRWVSDAYLVYLQWFSDRELTKTCSLMRDLRWKSEDTNSQYGQDRHASA